MRYVFSGAGGDSQPAPQPTEVHVPPHLRILSALVCLALCSGGANAARIELPGGGQERPAIAPFGPGIKLPAITGRNQMPALTTLAPAPASSDAVETLRLIPRPTIALAGEGGWDDGPIILRNAFATLYEAASTAGLVVTGRPFAVFRETDDQGYRFEAMLPVERPVAAGDPRVTVSESPGGFALRFVHEGSFEDIDLTYDIIASHLEAEGLEPQDLFIEEFVTGDFIGEPTGAVELEATVYIYVFPQ
jgi:effector-binding domain-containing protein